MKFGSDPMIRAAWLYYAEQRTQAEVATALGISRATVANLLADARRQGLVTIQLAPDLLRQIELARELEEAYGLDGVYVVPALESDTTTPAAVRQRLGNAGAEVLATMMKPDSVLGVAWGRTMADLGQALPERRFPDATVVQISGSSLGDAVTSPEACTLLIAARFGALCYNFHAPAVVSTRALQEALLQEPPLAQHFERIRSCDTVVFGVGELTETTRWADGDQLIRPAVDAYRAAGSEGILIGRFIDSEGRALDGPLSGRQIGMELGDLRAIATRLCVAGGPDKAVAIRAALRGGYVTHLVTDSAAAAILREGETT